MKAEDIPEHVNCRCATVPAEKPYRFIKIADLDSMTVKKVAEFDVKDLRRWRYDSRISDSRTDS